MSGEICADHEMPSSMESKLNLLDNIIRTGLERLLVEARNRQFLHPPYGRPAPPNPLVSEDEFLRSCSAAEYQHINDEPQFHYIYGFNPLTFLADYMHWAHPNSYLSRKIEVEKCFERLKLRARHANRMLKTADSLTEIASTQRSGLLWGPICSSITSTTAFCYCKAVRAGTIVVDISEDSEFESILKSVEIDTTEETLHIPSKVKLDDLKPLRRYYVRACLRDLDYPPKVVVPPSPAPTPGKMGKGLSKFSTSLKAAAVVEVAPIPQEISYDYRFGGPQDGFFLTSQFWSLGKDAKELAEEEESENNKQNKFAIIKKESDSKSNLTDGQQQEIEAATNLNDIANQFVIFAVGSVFNSDVSNDLDSLEGEFLLDIDKMCELVGVETDSRILTCLLGDIFSRQPYSGYISSARDYLREIALSGTPSARPALDNNGNNSSGDAAGAGTTDAAQSEPHALVKQMFVEIETAKDQLHLEMSKVMEVYLNRIRQLMVKGQPFAYSNSLLRNSNLLLAWNDLRVGSDLDLKYEEVAVRKHHSDVKRYNKKYEAELKKKAQSKRALPGTVATVIDIPPPPTLQLPPVSPSVHALMQSFPVDGREDSSRAFYKEIRISESVDAFILDSRDSYLGKSQARWLRHKLDASQATWKLVFVGFPLSVKVNTVELNQASTTGEENNYYSNSNMNTNRSSNGSPATMLGNSLEANSVVTNTARSATNPSPALVEPLNTSDGANNAEGDQDLLSGRSAGGGSKGGTARQVQITSAPVSFDGPDDVDEKGKPKYTLSYLIGSMQAKLDASIATGQSSTSALKSLESLGLSDGSGEVGAKLSEDIGNNPSMASEDGGAGAGGEDNSVGSNTTEDEDGERVHQLSELLAPGQLLQKVESGIIFFSSGVDTPYVAALDTSNWNRAYCLEVGVGSPVPSTTARDTLAENNMQTYVEPIKELEPTFLFGGEHLFNALDCGRPIMRSSSSASLSGFISSDEMKPIPKKSVCAITYDSVEDTLGVKILGSALEQGAEPAVMVDFMLYVPAL